MVGLYRCLNTATSWRNMSFPFMSSCNASRLITPFVSPSAYISLVSVHMMSETSPLSCISLNQSTCPDSECSTGGLKVVALRDSYTDLASMNILVRIKFCCIHPWSRILLSLSVPSGPNLSSYKVTVSGIAMSVALVALSIVLQRAYFYILFWYF